MPQASNDPPSIAEADTDANPEASRYTIMLFATTIGAIVSITVINLVTESTLPLSSTA